LSCARDFDAERLHDGEAMQDAAQSKWRLDGVRVLRGDERKIRQPALFGRTGTNHELG
jgi:hypothetical protein